MATTRADRPLHRPQTGNADCGDLYCSRLKRNELTTSHGASVANDHAIHGRITRIDFTGEPVRDEGCTSNQPPTQNRPRLGVVLKIGACDPGVANQRRLRIFAHGDHRLKVTMTRKGIDDPDRKYLRLRQ